jgi:tetratricopeptide (TPR) repeat protein
MIGPLVLIVAGVTTWLEKRDERHRAALEACAGGIMLFLAGNAFFYAISWQDEEHLWEHTLASNHDAWQAHNRLGAKKLAKGDVDGAYYHFRNSSRLRPDLGETKNNLAITLMRKGQVDQAIKTYEEALAASPSLHQIRLNLAEAYGTVGRFAEARDAYAQLVAIDPGNIVVRNSYALALFKSGEKEQAAAEFRRVLELQPDFKAAQQGLEIVLKDLEPAKEKELQPAGE